MAIELYHRGLYSLLLLHTEIVTFTIPKFAKCKVLIVMVVRTFRPKIGCYYLIIRRKTIYIL